MASNQKFGDSLSGYVGSSLAVGDKLTFGNDPNIYRLEEEVSDGKGSRGWKLKIIGKRKEGNGR